MSQAPEGTYYPKEDLCQKYKKDLDRSLKCIEAGAFQRKCQTFTLAECIVLGCAAKVSIGYLLSADFAQLAIQRTGKDDPSFIDTRQVMSKPTSRAKHK